MKLRIIFTTLLVLKIAIVSWLIFSTNFFINQKTMTIVKDSNNQWVMSSVRETPFGTVEADWWAEYRLLAKDDSLVCSERGIATYRQLPGDLSQYVILDWAFPCLEQGPPISITYSRRVWLFGFIPLRPAVFNFVINPDSIPSLDVTPNVVKKGEQ
jgi:hypothetical protein